METRHSCPDVQITCGTGDCMEPTSWTERNPDKKLYGGPAMPVVLQPEIVQRSMVQPTVNPFLGPLGDCSNNPLSNQSPQTVEKDVCFRCNKVGHWARVCPEKVKTKKELPAVDEMECPCGAGTCLLLTSKTQRNPGRKFYKCPGKDDENCHFFLWCDMRKADHNHDVSQPSKPRCPCGAGICRIEIKRDGNAVGQKVFVCPIKKGEGACSFYQVLDSPQKPVLSICLEQTNGRQVGSNAREDNEIDVVRSSKLEGMLPSELPKKLFPKESDVTADTNELTSGVLIASFLPVEHPRLNKGGSAESDMDLDESTQSRKVKHCLTDSTGSPGAIFKLVKDYKTDLHAYNAQLSCILEFDGASKGNPGQAGAGAVLRVEDGSIVCRLREGVGIATNNVAEYRALILGLKYALKKGFTQIHARGDSLLVCKQVEGRWKTKNPNMSRLCNETIELKNKFSSFHINYVARDANSEADAQANLAVNLADGEVQEVSDY